MSFRMQGQRITLQGDPNLYQSLVSLKSMVRAMQKCVCVGGWVCMCWGGGGMGRKEFLLSMGMCKGDCDGGGTCFH